MSGSPGGLSASAGAGAYGPALRGSNTYRDIDNDKMIVADGIQNVGRETLYRRGRQWIANNAKDLDPEQDKAKIQEIKRFSDEYFALVRANTADENAILAAQQPGEELLCRFRGQAFLVK